MVRDDLTAVVRSDINAFGTGNIEHLWCEISNANQGKMLTIGLIYRPPNCNPVDDANLLLLLKMVEDITRGTQLVVMGDFNHPGINWSTGDVQGPVKQQEFLKTTQDNCWVQNVSEHTRVRVNNQPSLLDLVFTRTNLEINDMLHLAGLGKSDHVVLKFSMVIEKLMKRESEPPKKNYYKADFEAIRAALVVVDWEEEFSNRDVNACYERLIEIYNDLDTKFVPLKKTKAEFNKPRWLTKDVKRAIREKDDSWKNWQQWPTPVNLKRYATKRNKATKVKRQAKNTYEENLVTDMRGDKKKFYSYVRSKTTLKKGIGVVQKEDGTLTTSDQETANVLNKAFQSVFSKDSSTTMSNSNTIKQSSDEQSEITEKEILSIICDLDVSKATGPDNIPAILIKECRVELLKPLSILFNKSLQTSTIPELWRKANVTPIYKKGKKTEPLNYRPVSLTCILCKILEKMLKARLLTEMRDADWFGNVQHGFRSERSTVTNLIEFYDSVTEEMDSGKPVDILFFDMAKAFDTVPHSKLIDKMRMMNINMKITDWIENYLQNRKQCVVVKGVKSEELKVSSGVPQGSVIGPFLFLLYISDMQKGIESKLSIFADDTKMAGQVGNVEGRAVMKRDLARLQTWADANEMKFNTEKCCVMHCGSKNNKEDYYLYGVKLRKTVSEKDLGVIVDNDMKFKHQVDAASKKANRNLGLIKRNFSTVSKRMFTILYPMLVRPHLEYAIQLWSPTQLSMKNKLDTIQRRATKIVAGLKKDSQEDRLRKLDLMSMDVRRDRGDMILTYKILHKKVDLGRNILRLNRDSRTRGHSLKLSKRQSRLNIRKNFFVNRIVDRWNGLQEGVVDSISVDAFKRAYDRSEQRRSTTSPHSALQKPMK
jgi:Reverse transcriptase (RNA-dependent DNA polymerase)/Endonuclease-reverse transcriptase